MFGGKADGRNIHLDDGRAGHAPGKRTLDGNATGELSLLNLVALQPWALGRKVSIQHLCPPAGVGEGADGLR